MTITAIKQQERLKGRYSIFVDERYAFSLSADALLDAKLHNGQALDEHQLKTYKKLSQDDKAYGLALAYVMRRMRSRYEITDYFRRKGYDPALSQQLLQKLETIGQVNDEAFAEAWVRNRRLLKPTSIRKLTQELRQKRISDDIILRVLTKETTDEYAVLQEMVLRKRRQTRYQDPQKLMRYLAGQGFNYTDIKTVLADITDEGDERAA